jgi:hypothetical protein
MLKYLLIAVTALSLTACVLLIALWVRSYWWCDIFEKRTASQLIQVDSQSGRLSFHQFNPVTLKVSPTNTKTLLDALAIGRFYSCCPVAKIPRRPYWHQVSTLGVGHFSGGLDRVMFVPHWLPILILAACTALPWIRSSPRFGLRTLLIATTLVAVGLRVVALSS